MEKIKLWIESDKGKNILTILVIILVGLGSFELGRLSKKGSSSSGIKIEYPEGQNQAASAAMAQGSSAGSVDSGKAYFASNKGTKYYSVSCSGGKTIKEENRVYFSTVEEAERAGYEISTSCK